MAEDAKKFPTLSRRILEGKRYTELGIFTTKATPKTPGEKFQVTIRALGGGELAECYRAAGIPATLTTLQGSDLLILGCYLISKAATGMDGEKWLPEEIAEWIDLGAENMKLITRIMQISGEAAGEAETIQSFREKPQQPTG